MAAASSIYKVICGHECLEEFADRFLYAVTHHDASAAPLAPGVRYTENGQVLAIGDALWATAQGLGANKLVVTDPASGGIMIYAGLVESGLPSMFAARLKVENRQITEIETTVIRRNADDAAMAQFAVPRPIWQQAVAPNRHLSRQQLADVADSYFEGITQARGDITPLDPMCTRFENGGQMTLRTDAGANAVTKMSCQAQFAAGMLAIVTSVTHRRYPVIDEDNQIVSAIVTFDHRGNLESVPMERGRALKPQGAFSRPFSFLIFETFKVIDGKIRQVEATVYSAPYRMDPGWPAK
ncbi:MAG TPA: hypothetical protein VGG49_05455 [Steroidobacteraceae bacterium]|jgi:hypothetical protein